MCEQFIGEVGEMEIYDGYKDKPQSVKHFTHFLHLIQFHALFIFRMMDMCEQFIGEVGEMEIYDGYKDKPQSVKHFTHFLCLGEGMLGECTAVEKAQKEEKKKKKEEL